LYFGVKPSGDWVEILRQVGIIQSNFEEKKTTNKIKRFRYIILSILSPISFFSSDIERNEN